MQTVNRKDERIVLSGRDLNAYVSLTRNQGFDTSATF
jgi:hypothetical protein